MTEPEMVTVPAGQVAMALPKFPAGCTLPHPWTEQTAQVPAFAIARYAVTAGQMRTFADETGYAIAGELSIDPRFQDADAPAAFVSWIDAVRYAQWLALATGKPYRLVRDAEYEYAARGGLVGKRYPWGNEPPEGRADFGNPSGAPKKVGSFAPNGYGLFDRAGSMWSWCEECYDQVVKGDRAKMCYDDSQIKDVRLNPICRGGSYKSEVVESMWCAHRHEDPVDGRFDCIGFRLAMSV